MADPAGPPAWRVAVAVPRDAVDAFEAAFSAAFDVVSCFETDDEAVWTVEGYSRTRPDRGPLAASLALAASATGIAEPAPVVERLPETDWLAASYRSFPPIRIGRFVIHGSHVENAVPPGAVGLTIDAATAFGTGEHPTTRGCLMAIESLAKRRRVARALDMGCGTGVLAFAVARMWGCPVLAADVDREAIRVARINARVNRVASRVSTAVSDGYRNPVVTARGPYDLIVANILARPLVAMAGDLAARLAPGGTAVLSGLLSRQERQVLNAHRAQGLVLAARIPIGVWTTLVLERR